MCPEERAEKGPFFPEERWTLDVNLNSLRVGRRGL